MIINTRNRGCHHYGWKTNDEAREWTCILCGETRNDDPSRPRMVVMPPGRRSIWDVSTNLEWMDATGSLDWPMFRQP